MAESGTYCYCLELEDFLTVLDVAYTFCQSLSNGICTKDLQQRTTLLKKMNYRILAVIRAPPVCSAPPSSGHLSHYAI